MELLNGKSVSDATKDNLKTLLNNLRNEGAVGHVNLAVIQVGNNDASSVYIKNKMKACEYVGIDSSLYTLPENISEEDVISLVESLNYDEGITGILVQLPLPKHLDEQNILQRVHPTKDVDGFTAYNAGKLFLGENELLPCTPYGVMTMLDNYGIEVAGKECVVVGRSNIVGKPMAMLLLQADGTVTICHSKTKNLKEICKRADILVCAIGKPKFFNRDYVKNGAVVIDVGIHRMDNGKLCGDVDFDDVKDIVSFITPVPNGVGATTVASLMSNCIIAAANQYTNNY